ncbi:hypothetical protein XENTR_v10017509 [Xenopus tropicalis]|nr:hypothetical protein XENTR_v10017509 [Xenopus tropicalis]
MDIGELYQESEPAVHRMRNEWILGNVLIMQRKRFGGDQPMSGAVSVGLGQITSQYYTVCFPVAVVTLLPTLWPVPVLAQSISVHLVSRVSIGTLPPCCWVLTVTLCYSDPGAGAGGPLVGPTGFSAFLSQGSQLLYVTPSTGTIVPPEAAGHPPSVRCYVSVSIAHMHRGRSLTGLYSHMG